MNEIALSLLLNEFSSSQVNDIYVNGLALDSRLVKPGNLFFACKGAHVDGKNFVNQAIEQGAHVVLTDAPLASDFSTPIIYIPKLSEQIGIIASRFYQEPSKKMQVIGITGTNGKTSCSHFIGAALNELNEKCGIIGTLGNGLFGDIQPSNLTTPDAITLQVYLKEFLEKGAKYVAMEVSSHSIDQGRINGVDYAVSVFTNLTRDHLDYHGTMQAYGDTKKKLFESYATKNSVINADDPFGKKIINDLQNKKNIFAYGSNVNSISNIPFIYSDKIELDWNGIRGYIYSPWGDGEFHANLIGQFNVSNLLAVFTTLCLLEIPVEKVLQILSKVKSVDGRMQTLGGHAKPLIIIDYAHTPDALEKVLIALRSHCSGKLYCVFGCGGDRDRGKRPQMGKIAERFSDYLIVTDDNPRTEDPKNIFKDIEKGFDYPEKVIFEHDRAKSIQQAIKAAEPGDCVLIAGKGAETYQIIGEEKLHFSDVEQVKLNL